MSIDDKKAAFNGGPYQSYWYADEHNPVHPTVTIRFDHEVDPVMLGKAWEAAKTVYPLIGMTPDDDNDELLFFENREISIPIQSKAPISLVSEKTAYCGFGITYFGDSVSLSAYHSLVDERGLLCVCRTLVSYYLSLYTGSDTDNDAQKNRQPADYFVQNTVLVSEDYEPQPVLLYNDIKELFVDDRASAFQEDAIAAASIECQADSFMQLCEKNEGDPESVLCAVMAKAIYDMFPEERRKLGFGVLTDFRKTFGICDSIAPCSKRIPLLLGYDEVSTVPFRDVVRSVKTVREYQNSSDYIKTHVALENTYGLLELKSVSAAVAYAGEFDLGGHTSHITEIIVSDALVKSVFMIGLGDKIKIIFQYGAATEKYMTAAADVLRANGVETRVAVAPYFLVPDQSTPVKSYS